MGSEEVLRYISSRPSPMREICGRLREIILDEIPGIEERLRLGVPYFGGAIYILSLKDHVNLGFPIELLTPDQAGSLKGTGKTVRVVELRSLDDIDLERLGPLFRQVRDSRSWTMTRAR